jgi:rhodanese-related sulfurtransferase
LKVTDLENLDLAYAPQFSAAKDPVIMAGFVASNVSRSEIGTITCEQLQQEEQTGEDLQIVDVRTMEEYQSGHLGGAIPLPIDELRDRLDELDRDKQTVVYCRVGFRGYLAALILQQKGFDRGRNLSGGIMICPTEKIEVSPG